MKSTTKPAAKNIKVATKRSNPFIEKKEEQVHKDLDHDGEKGESAAHKAKVFGKKPVKPVAKKK